MKGLRLLRITDEYNIAQAGINELLQLMGIEGISLYKVRKLLEKLVPLEPTLVDCCINSCIAFTGEFSNKDICPLCGQSRYQLGKLSQTARKRSANWSPVDSLRAQYRDRTRAQILQYRHNYTSTEAYAIDNSIGDVFDDRHYKSLVSSGLFKDRRDVAFLASTDGYQIFRQKRDDCWIVLLINANLPPSTRVQRENLMISALIPRPRTPKNPTHFCSPL